jgi:hypothetical protein
MAIFNPTAMEGESVNLGWIVLVQKRQQIVETVAARHRITLHYCLSRYGIVSQIAPVLGRSRYDISRCGLAPIARKGR